MTEDDIPTPTFVLDARRLRANLETAKRVRDEAGCKVLLATKAFAIPAIFGTMRDYLDGTTASGEHEALMGAEAFGKEVHVYSPAYTEDEVRRLTKIAQHIYFNSAQQLEQFGGQARAAGAVAAAGAVELADPCDLGIQHGRRRAEARDGGTGRSDPARCV